MYFKHTFYVSIYSLICGFSWAYCLGFALLPGTGIGALITLAVAALLFILFLSYSRPDRFRQRDALRFSHRVMKTLIFAACTVAVFLGVIRMIVNRYTDVVV